MRAGDAGKTKPCPSAGNRKSESCRSPEEVTGDMEDFDWVTALDSCALPVVFEKLKSQAEQDVNLRNAQLTKIRASYWFKFSPDGDNFVISTLGNSISGSRAVKFKLAAGSITVYGPDDKLMLEAVLTLCDDGNCRLLVDGEEKELWQFRKRALEALLFHSPWER
jgi:hypothetical protein